MTEPLALILYEKLIPGSQLVNRLQDLKYRVQTVSNPSMLLECAEQTKPMVVFVDLHSSKNDVCGGIAKLRQNPATSHLPVIAFSSDEAQDLQATAKQSGATILANESAILSHLPQLLDQALQLE